MSRVNRPVAGIAILLALSGCVGDPVPAPVDEQTLAGLAAVDREREKLATRGPKPFSAPADRHIDFLRRRVAEGEDYPFQHLRNELDTLLAREQARTIAGGETSAAWDWLGPGNIGGRTRALAIDPTDPDTMYAGAVAGGVWKTTNGGASWAPTDDLMLNLAIASLAIDPADPSVLYAGTGEGVLLGSPGLRGLGIFKSTDAGMTWNQLPATASSAFYYVNKVRVSANDSNHVYAATRTGVWRSLDGGMTWDVVLANPVYIGGAPVNSNGSDVGCTDLQIRPDSDPDQLFACFGSFDQDGLFRSDDGGDTWVAYTTPLNQGRMTLAFAPSNNDIVYLLMANNGATAATGKLVNVYKSVDGGVNWAAQVNFNTLTGEWLLSNLILATNCVPEAGPTYSQGWYDNIIAVDPSDPDTVWVGGVDIFRSDDGGVTWNIPAYWIFYAVEPAPPYQVHPDHHNIVFHPDYDGGTNQTMYVTNDGGIFKTDNARAATSQEDCPLPGDEPFPEIVWERLNNNYGVTQFYHGDSAVQADVFVGGAQDNGSSRVQSVGAPNDWSIVFGGDGGYCAIDHTNPDVMYVEYQFFPNIQKSVDGGETFVEANTGITDTDGTFITPFAMDPSDPEILWTGGSRPWRTTNGADLWELAGGDFPGAGTITAIAIAPADGNVVYMGFNTGHAARSTNALSATPTWQVFANGLSGAWVSSIGIHPDDPDIAYLTYSNFGVSHVRKTVNGGLTWFSVDGIDFDNIPDIPAHWVEVRPCDGEEVFVGTELGMFRSPDGGATWTPFNVGLTHTIVASLDFRNDRKLVAFTHGRGAYQVILPPCGPCPADLDGNGVVDAVDFLDLLAAWGPCPGCPEDLDGNDVVDTVDFLALLAAWGPCP